MMMYDKETIYDEQINPLMSKIIDICKENGIEMVCSFSLNDADLVCTTHLKSDVYENKAISDACKVIQCGYVVEKPWFGFAIKTEGAKTDE